MYTPKIYDRVSLVNTTADVLDGQKATVMGNWSNSCSIIVFDTPPVGYNPAIVIVNVCLKQEE